MSIAPKLQNIQMPVLLNPAISKSSDLRLPVKFTKLNQQYIEDEFAVVEDSALTDACQFMEMNDDGMYPTIAMGAMLEVDAHLQPKHNDIVVAKYYGEVICRRIFISKRKTWLYCDDKNFKFIDLSDNDEVEIMGVVTSHFMSHNVA